MAEQVYPEVTEATISRWNAEDGAAGLIDTQRLTIARMTAEIERLNKALDIGVEQARRVRHEVDVQTARADLAESKVRYAAGVSAKAAAFIRDGAARMRALVTVADRYSWADGVKIRHCCNTTTDEKHAPDCPVRMAEEWLAP